MKNKFLAITMAILLSVLMASSMMLIPTTSAHTPPWQIPTYAYIYASPNPVGVGQFVHVDMFLDKVIDSAALNNNIRFENYQLTITAPDGKKTVETFAVVTDPTSNQDYSFTPSETGTYTFNFTFPGQTFTFTQAVSSIFGPPAPSQYIGDYYEPSSASATLTVQQSPVPVYPTTPLPTTYWTRPIYGTNSNWYTVSSNYLGRNAPGYESAASGLANPGLVPNGVGPLTGHIMWTKPLQSGGVVGGNNSLIPGYTYTDGSAYSLRYTNPIVMDGMLYYSEPLGYNAPTGGPTVCVDLLTGQIIWSSTTVPSPTFGYIYDIQDPNQHGATIPLLISQTGGFGFFGPPSPIQWQAYDADTGAFMFSVSNIPAGASAMGPNGEYLSYVFANDGTPTKPQYYLGQWNSSKLWDSQYSGLSTTPSNAPPITDGSSSSLYDWNVSEPSLNTLAVAPTILVAYAGNMMLCMSGTYPGSASAFTVASWTPYTYYAINLNPNKGTIGSILWTQTLTAPPGNISVSFNGADPSAGVFTEAYKETLQFVGYSLSTGQKLWGPVTHCDSPLAFYNEGNPMADGKLFQIGYGGVVYCYDTTNGNLLWTYGNGGEGNNTSGGLATAFPNYPAVIYAIGNGVVYILTSEHDVETPIYKGALARAINETTGKEIWTLSDDSNGLGVGLPGGAIADGYATFFNAYDNQIYSVGRGPSATTVSAPQVGVTTSTPVTITGSVMDISAGTKQNQQAADFPNGVPCSSDASMREWMGYVYQQQMKPTNFTGVPVQLAVLDSNGNHYPIGTATTDSSGTFSLTWTPSIAGNFTVYATFAGTNGYWPSSAETHLNAGTTPTTAPTSTPNVSNLATNTNLLTYMAIGVIAIIIAIAIVGLLLLRRHP